MSASNAARWFPAPPCDDQATGHAVAAASSKKSATARQSRRVPTDEDILDAAHWRLAGWSTDAVEAATERIAGLVDRKIPLDTAEPQVAESLAHFDHDRRDPWSALCAIAALFADGQGDQRLFLAAGFEVLQAFRQSTRGRRHGADALTQIITGLVHHEDATADAIFDVLAAAAGDEHAAIISYNVLTDTLTALRSACRPVPRR